MDSVSLGVAEVERLREQVRVLRETLEMAARWVSEGTPRRGRAPERVLREYVDDILDATYAIAGEFARDRAESERLRERLEAVEAKAALEILVARQDLKHSRAEVERLREQVRVLREYVQHDHERVLAGDGACACMAGHDLCMSAKVLAATAPEVEP